MKKTKPFWVALALLLSSCQTAPDLCNPKATLQTNQTRVEVPLERGLNQLFAPVKLNGRDAGYFHLDTGAGLNLVDRPLSHRLGLPRIGRGTVSGTGGSQPCLLARLNKLQIGQVNLGVHEIAIVDLGTLNAHSRKKIGGALGHPLFSCFPFTLDYSAGTLTFHRRATFVPPDEAFTAPMQIKGGTPYIKARVNGIYEGWFLLDTGSTSNIQLDESFVRQCQNLVLRPRHSRLVGARGGPQVFKTISVSSLELLGQTFNDVLGDMHANEQKSDPQIAGIIGGGILKRFRLTFDYDRKQLWAQHRPDPSISDAAATDTELEARDFFGYTALSRAVYDNDIERVRRSLARGADVNVRNNQSQTPLMISAYIGAVQIGHLLIRNGADVDAADNSGDTALLLAALGGDEEFVESLVIHGADVNAASNAGVTPLMMAAAMGHTQTAKTLLDHKADATAADNEGHIALELASRHGHQKIVQLLKRR